MKIDKNAIALTENLTDEQLNSTALASILDGFIKSSEKRNTPIPITLDDLFYVEDEEDEEDEGYGYFYPSVLRNYIAELDSCEQHTLRKLFTCLNNNIRIKPDKSSDDRHKSILVTIFNHYEGGKFVFELPYCSWLYDFLWQYTMLEISCDVTFEQIKTYLEI